MKEPIPWETSALYLLEYLKLSIWLPSVIRFWMKDMKEARGKVEENKTMYPYWTTSYM